MTDLVALHQHQGRLTPQELRGQIDAVEELIKTAVLRDRHDYGTIPGTPKPTLFKSGAERLLMWAQFGHRLDVVEVERDDEGRKYGVTYRCSVHSLADGSVIATCDGYCGYDEPDRDSHQNRWGKQIERSPWNTILKMAQKRALVGAALQATGTSSVFTQDLEDISDATAGAGSRNDDLGDIAKLSNRQLVEALRARDLPLAGKPDELRARLAEAVGSEPAAQATPDAPDSPSPAPRPETAPDAAEPPADAPTSPQGRTGPPTAEEKLIIAGVKDMSDEQVLTMIAAYGKTPDGKKEQRRGQLLALMLAEEARNEALADG